MPHNDGDILPVLRSKAEAKQAYDRLSGVYDYLTGPFEKKAKLAALDLLEIQPGEHVLEIGFGTGQCLVKIAERVGEAGKVDGIDMSPGMLEVARKRLRKAGLLGRVELRCADALNLPYTDNTFDVVFMSFVLELFDTPEIPLLLADIKRCLKPGGRLGVAAMSKESDRSALLSLYEWAHEKFPQYADCRPIYVRRCLAEAGFAIRREKRVAMAGLPGEIVVGVKEAP